MIIREGVALNHISRKDINLGQIFVILFSISIVGGFIKWPLFIFADVFLFSYIVLDRKRLRCPNCGAYENLDRLIYAKNHVHNCRRCGERIKIL